jgi:TolB-like protein/Tfp pilus assembly protein PilF
MSFCLDDGSELLYGPASMDEPATAILAEAAAFRTGGEATAIFKQSSPAVEPNSIAVLPFAHLSSQPDDEFFCDGLAEELINALTKIESLKVAARTSAFSFKATNKKIGEIAQALGVNKILEGSVRKAGDRVRITVQLINAADGYQIWSERYDREMQDIFAVQDEITLAVVEALKVKLLSNERVAVLKKATDDPEAYEFYLRGRVFWNRRTPADLHKAIANFEKAIEIDPEYSLAFSGLADSYTLLTYFEEYAPHELRERTRECALKAVELDEASAEAHTSMALYRLIYEFDLQAADHHFRKALDLNPRLVTAQYLYGTHLATQLHFDEAVAHGKIALDLDPLNQALNGNIARVLYFLGRFDEAIELANKNLELAPNFFFMHWALGVCYRQKADFERALDHLQKAVSFSGLVALKGDLGVAYALAGKEAEARSILAELEARSKESYVSPQWPAVIYAALGDKEKALDCLESAWDVRAVQLLWLRIDPNFAPLRLEPRFIEILEKTGVATSMN